MESTFFFVMMLLLPGMSQPLVEKQPVATYIECLNKVAVVNDKIAANHAGEEFKMLAGCEINGKKSDPS